MEERRRNKRLDLKVSLLIERLDEGDITTVKYANVDVQDISKSGLGFHCSQALEIGSIYNVKLEIWTKEIIKTAAKIVRSEKIEDGFAYGCQFVGMSESDELKIQIYQIINEK